MRRWPEGLPRGNKQRFPADPNSDFHRAYGRNSVRYVPWKDYKTVTTYLKRIYQSATEEEALLALDQFSETWDEKYPHSGSLRYCFNAVAFDCSSQ